MAFELRSFQCSNKAECKFKHTCTKLPVAIHNQKQEDRHRIDVLFVTEFPGKPEIEAKTPFAGKFMQPGKACIDHLSTKYKFSYALTSLHKSRRIRDSLDRPFSPQEISECAKSCFEREVKYLNPRIIVGFGLMAHEFFTDKECDSIFVHSGCITSSRKLAGKRYDYISCIHPSWVQRYKQEPNSVGFIYRDIEKALVYTLNGVDLRIPNKFESVVLSSVKDVKNVLNEIRNTNDYAAVDTETCNLYRVYGNRILSMQLCSDGKVGYVIPLQHFDSPFIGKDLDKIFTLFRDFFTQPTSSKGYVYVNNKYDYHQVFRDLHIFQLNAPQIDCSYAEFCLDENWARVAETSIFPKRKGPFSLYTMALKRGFTYYSTTASKERRDILEKLPLSEWKDYAGADAVSTWNVWKSQLRQAKAIGHLEQFKKTTIKLHNHISRSLTYTEHCGMGTNTNVLKDLYNPRTSIILKAMNEVVAELNSMPSVKKLCRNMQNSRIGYSGSFLGTVAAFQPTKRLQLEQLFFDILGLEPLVEGKLSVDKDFQKAYKDTVPEVKKLSEYNKLATLQKMFVNPIYEMMIPGTSSSTPDFYTDDRIRSHYRWDAVTGRLRSQGPNLQQRPAHGDRIGPLLKMYDGKPGRIVIKIDFATFEVRGLCFLSNDEAMKEAFEEMYTIKSKFRENPECYAKDAYKVYRKALKYRLKKARDSQSTAELLKPKERKQALKSLNFEIKEIKKEARELKKRLEENPIGLSKDYVKWTTDFHRRSASLFHEVPITEVSGEQRQGTKGLVFGRMYGMGEESLAGQLGVSVEIARALGEKFASSMPKAVKWLETSAKRGRRDLYVESPLGTIRHLWGHLLENKSISAKLDRIAKNTVIQGTCSNLNIVGTSLLIDFIHGCGKAKYQVPDEEAWFITNLVHDSCEAEIPIEDTEVFIREAEPYFTSKLVDFTRKEWDFPIAIPLEVDFNVGTTYADMIGWDGSDKSMEKIKEFLIETCSERDGKDYSYLRTKNWKKSIKPTYAVPYSRSLALGGI